MSLDVKKEGWLILEKKKRYFILCGDGQLKCFDKKPDSPIATKHLKKND